jgi:hypothetical protein
MFAARGQVLSDKPLIEATISTQPALATTRGRRPRRTLTRAIGKQLQVDAIEPLLLRYQR